MTTKERLEQQFGILMKVKEECSQRFMAIIHNSINSELTRDDIVCNLSYIEMAVDIEDGQASCYVANRECGLKHFEQADIRQDRVGWLRATISNYKHEKVCIYQKQQDLTRVEYRLWLDRIAKEFGSRTLSNDPGKMASKVMGFVDKRCNQIRAIHSDIPMMSLLSVDLKVEIQSLLRASRGKWSTRKIRLFTDGLTENGRVEATKYNGGMIRYLKKKGILGCGLNRRKGVTVLQIQYFIEKYCDTQEVVSPRFIEEHIEPSVACPCGTVSNDAELAYGGPP